MDKDTRNAIERATQRARKLLEEDFAAQLEGDFDVHRDGAVAAKAGVHLSARQAIQRERIVAALEHKRAAGMSSADAARDYLRDAAFTTLNRFFALKMLEARDLVQECITKGEQSAGYREFCGMAPGLPLLREGAGYRLYIESLLDELSTEVKVLFDRRDPSSVLWPKRATFEQLLEILNAADLGRVWAEDETIGWVYQFYNGQDERRKMREESQAPRNSREMAVRNQFFTPRYVVQFLVDNTLGRIWYEMRGTVTVLAERCEYMVRKRGEASDPRLKKDPRDLHILDPACGSGHFLLYAFDLLLTIYDEAYVDPASPKSEATGKTLAEDYPSLDALRKAVPGLVLMHNLYGVDIDPRCAQIAQLALWMRAHKAYRDFGVDRAERPPIRRSNIVVAEPLVADEQIAKDFAAMLGDVDLRRVFTSLVTSLRLAGDLGLLLRVEQLVQVPRKQGELFAPTEERFRATLEGLVRKEAGGSKTRLRLFADDTQQGTELLRLAQERFDVVLMNPPFGLPTDRSKDTLQELYPDTWKDVYAAFADRGLELLVPSGLLGIISPSSWLYSRQLREFRRRLLDLGSPRQFVELGGGVMDEATVEACLWCASPAKHGTEGFLLDLVGEQESARPFLLKQMAERGNSVRYEAFVPIEGAPLCYHMPAQMLALWSQTKRRLDPSVAEVAIGCKTFNDSRFLRLWWEVAAETIGIDWRTFRAGGDYQPFTASSRLVLKWRDGGRENRCFGIDRHGSDAQVAQSSRLWDRVGLAYPRVGTAGLGIRVAREGEIFSHSSVFIRPRDAEDVWGLLAFLNAPITMRLYEAHGRSRLTETIAVKDLPLDTSWQERFRQELSELARSAWAIASSADALDETSRTFRGVPAPVNGGTNVVEYVAGSKERLKETVAEIDCRVRRILCLPADIAGWNDLDNWQWRVEHREYSKRALSYLVGLAVGRFTAPLLESCNQLIGEPNDAFSALPPLSYAAASGVSPASRAHPIGGILVDDDGHPADIVTQVVRVSAENGVAESELETIAQAGSGRAGGLRAYFAEQFFADHIRAYSAMARRAPVYWQLATRSATYSVWLYIHALSKDSLFRVQNDYVAPKLAHEERRLEALTSELRDRATSAQRRQLAARETFVDDLRSFLEEVRRVAPLWKPNLDDGVIINFAPLWRLVPQNKSWQKELKSTWDALCEGKYDWAHLAMHLWPERVVPKCAKDRSLAIAHGLEDVFWVKGTDGKWTARTTPTRSVDELVRERTSPAVKSALKCLLEAPVASRAAKTTRKGKADA